MSRRSSKLSMTGRSHHSCVRCPKTAPMRATCLMRSRQGTNPPTSQWPAVGSRIPQRILMVVDFPAPFGPMRPSSSPSRSVKLMPLRASTIR